MDEIFFEIYDGLEREGPGLNVATCRFFPLFLDYKP
jgi:hypothetical protein